VTERVFEMPRGVLGDVLIEGARQGARGEDALDGGVVARAERRGMAERAIDLIGGVALAQEQDLARLRTPDPGRPLAHQAEELGRQLAHVAKCDVDLIEIDRALPLGRGMQAGRVEPKTRTARRELVARDTLQIGGVHK